MTMEVEAAEEVIRRVLETYRELILFLQSYDWKNEAVWFSKLERLNADLNALRSFPQPPDDFVVPYGLLEMIDEERNPDLFLKSLFEAAIGDTNTREKALSEMDGLRKSVAAEAVAKVSADDAVTKP